MKFRTHYNFSAELDLDPEKGFPSSETDASQNEDLSQLIRRFVSQGLVIPPVHFVEQTEEEIDEMLNNDAPDVNDDDFDLADASETLAEAQKIIQNLQKKQDSTPSTPKAEKAQEEPKTAQEEGEPDK